PVPARASNWFSSIRIMAGTSARSRASSTRYARPRCCIRSVVVLEALGELLDVLGRPARHFHAEMQPHLRQHFLDLVERLAAEVRRPQHLGLGLLHQIADVDDVVVLETIGRTHAELELVDLLEE